jgi:hypothetical protein
MVIDNHGKFTIFLACLVCILPAFEIVNKKLSSISIAYPKIIFTLHFILFFLAMLKVGTASISPFIYFMF